MAFEVDALNLPNGIKQQISAAQVGISARLTLEAQIVQIDFERQLYTADKINYFLSDTLETNPIDSVIKMLTVESRPYASKELVQAYIAKGDYANALSLINSQPTNDFYELQKLIIQVNQAPEKAYSMKTNPALKSSIEAYANDCSKEGCAYAQALLRQVFNNQYPELRILPNDLNQRSIQNNENGVSSIDTAKFIIYPNPNDGNMMLDYSLNAIDKGEIAIYDIAGKLIYKYDLDVSASQIIISHKGFNNGIYFYRITVNGNTVQSNKLIIIK